MFLTNQLHQNNIFFEVVSDLDDPRVEPKGSSFFADQSHAKSIAPVQSAKGLGACRFCTYMSYGMALPIISHVLEAPVGSYPVPGVFPAP